MLALRALPVPVVCALCLQHALPKSCLSLEVKLYAIPADSYHRGVCTCPSNCFQDDGR